MEPMDLPSHAVFQPQKRLCVAIDEKRDFLGQSQVRTKPNSICAHNTYVIITCVVFFLLLLLMLFANTRGQRAF